METGDSKIFIGVLVEATTIPSPIVTKGFKEMESISLEATLISVVSKPTLESTRVTGSVGVWITKLPLLSV